MLLSDLNTIHRDISLLDNKSLIPKSELLGTWCNDKDEDRIYVEFHEDKNFSIWKMKEEREYKGEYNFSNGFLRLHYLSYKEHFGKSQRKYDHMENVRFHLDKFGLDMDGHVFHMDHMRKLELD